ncbi:hypothetical protein ACBJ59_61155 [Nonomuraea sp. MTCD27]|uniref:hypothetical protein n=1 Tax=Nonomuraea sp. MTCD27 TaxID=1676747 RepID=UPI0035C05350
MEHTYAIAPAAYAPPAPVQARLAPHPTTYRPLQETVVFEAGEEVYGYVFLPAAAAHDLVHRLEDTPATLSMLTAEVAGHVRYVLDREHTDSSDEPDQWVFDLITLIHNGTDEQRRRIGRGYAAYVWAVAIATGPDGLTQLRHLHETVKTSGSRPVGD